MRIKDYTSYICWEADVRYFPEAFITKQDDYNEAQMYRDKAQKLVILKRLNRKKPNKKRLKEMNKLADEIILFLHTANYYIYTRLGGLPSCRR